MAERGEGTGRQPLTRDRVLRTAVAVADEQGLEAVSMRRLAQVLGVVPMALYKHVANKDELLAAMVDAVVTEMGAGSATVGDDGWRPALRGRVLAAREVLLRHPWARRVMEEQVSPTPAVLAHQDAMIGLLLAGGLSVDLVHHVMHALGSRVFGFSQELYDAAPAPVDPELLAVMAERMGAMFPNIVAVATSRPHDPATVVGPTGCDDRFEFEFALDLLLSGVERLHAEGWTSAPVSR
ncbi:TetR/AcrR family transcriptional regulator [Cellulomonas endophytica]|uniref:TetR/AcrR family transcriptional regulator n=1 Tax=Cellulomonas endophytica TaxID=2494735 RepID=UPI001012F2B0|nr:TetR/AcrR family transcriptional regulator C-terminal domain-containing protein [Cellulomonas endophytica]